MDLGSAKSCLHEGGFAISDEQRLRNDTGTQLRLNNGVTVSVYDSGRYQVQGSQENKESVENCLRGATSSSITNSSIRPNSEVFVVYGHDESAKVQLEALLRRWQLRPLLLDQLPSQGHTIIEKVEHYANQVQYAVVLATPDDESYRRNHTEGKKFRARQNVVLELGMMLSKLGRERVAILLKTPDLMEKPSDIDGLIYIPFGDTIDAAAQVILANEMNACGYNIQVSDLA